MIDISLFSFPAKIIQDIRVGFIQDATSANNLGITELIDKVNEFVINPLIAFLFSAGLILFFYGIIMFLRNRENDPGKSNEGRQHMIWGVVGMFIMASVFGILNTIVKTLSFDNVIITQDGITNTDLDTTGGINNTGGATSGGAGNATGNEGVGNGNLWGGDNTGPTTSNNINPAPEDTSANTNNEENKHPSITMGYNNNVQLPGDQIVLGVVFTVADDSGLENFLQKGEIIIEGYDGDFDFTPTPETVDKKYGYSLLFYEKLEPGSSLTFIIKEGSIVDKEGLSNKQFIQTITGGN